MKNIFVAGIARSGKSTFSKMVKTGTEYNYIPMDYFVSSLKHNFPCTNISTNVVIDKNSSVNVGVLLSKVIDNINLQEEKFIIDSAHILPEDITKYLDRDKWDIYYFGYPNITALEKLRNIRKYDTEKDWTHKISDDKLLAIVDSLIDLSKKIQEDCEKLDIKFIDTSKDLVDTLKNIYEEL